MVTPHFRGIFGQEKEFFSGYYLKNYLKFVFYFSESWEFQVTYQSKCLQKCHYLKLNCSIRRKSGSFYKKCPGF
jgi:hypothetical protein